jgi:uncharacterized protein (DUF433 family)
MSIAETLVAKPPPLRLDGDGNLLVGGTRVPLDTVVGEYKDGASAEEIVRQYDSLRLSDVHAVISYYLENRSTVEQYLAERRQLAEKVRRENEARFPMTGIPPEGDGGVKPIWPWPPSSCKTCPTQPYSGSRSTSPRTWTTTSTERRRSKRVL